MIIFKRLVILWACLTAFYTISAQYEGKEFWYTQGRRLVTDYICQGDTTSFQNDTILVYVLGETACTGYIENPASSFHIDFTIQPGILTTLKIPADEITLISSPSYTNPVQHGKSFVLRTTAPVQAWAQTTNDFNYNPCREGNAIKTPLYPNEGFYQSFLHSYRQSVALSNLVIIATEDGTVIYSPTDSIAMDAGDVLLVNHGFGHITATSLWTNCKKVVAYEETNSGKIKELNNIHLCSGHDFLAKGMRNKIFDIHLYGYGDNPIIFPSSGAYTLQTYSPTRCASIRYPVTGFVQPRIIVFTNHIIESYTGLHVLYINGNWMSHQYENPLHPNEIMIKKWSFPITKNTFQLPTNILDTTYVDLVIYTHQNGISSTYFNGELLPATAFDTFPSTNGEYYYAQLAWWSSDSLPDYITVENPNGFSAHLAEIGYTVKYSGFPSIGDLMFPFYCMFNSPGYDIHTWPYPHSNLSMTDSSTVYRCVGDTLLLQVAHNPDSVPVEWIFDGDSYMASELTFLLPSVDTLTAQLVLHYDDCPDTTTTFIVVVPPPIFEVCHDTTLCHGAQLSVQQPNVLSYLWSDGSSGPALTVDSAGSYSVTVTNLGCKAESDLFTVGVYPQSSVEFGNDSILCELATLLLDATQPHPASYLWQDQSTNTTYTVFEDGQYWVVVTDHCLGASDTIAIGYLTDFTVDLGPDTTLCEGRTLLLSAENPFCDYEWQDGSTQFTYTVRYPGTYSVTASNQCFEHGDDITVEYEPCDQELWMPNSFTPNGDGLNDLFLPVFAYPDEVESFEMTIYDRWGMVQFMTRDKDQGWDAAGKPDGVYVVLVRYKSRGHETRDVTGSVAVAR